MKKLIILLALLFCLVPLAQADELIVNFTVQGDADSISLFHRERNVDDATILAKQGFNEEKGFGLTSPITWTVPYAHDVPFCMYPAVYDSNGDVFGYKDVFCFVASPAPEPGTIIDIPITEGPIIINITVQQKP